MVTKTFVIQAKLSHPLKLTAPYAGYGKTGDILSHKDFFDVTETLTHVMAEKAMAEFAHELLTRSVPAEELRSTWPNSNEVTIDFRILVRYVNFEE
jgi:hypothetical protein